VTILIQHIIKSTALCVGYDKHVILKDINIAVPQNSVTSIVGLNGTGKSTLLRSLCGLQKILSGEVLLHNKSLSDFSAGEIAKQISIVLTGRGEMVSSLSVYELLAMSRTPYLHWLSGVSGHDIAIIEESAKVAGVSHLIDRSLYTLSDGEFQLVGIARALAQETPIIILDEPTAHLDMQNKLEVFSLLRKLSKSGKTILFTSHDIDLALAISDHVLFIDKKGKVEFGETSSLIERNIPATYFDSANIQFDKETNRFKFLL